MPARLLVTATYAEDPDALFKRASNFADVVKASRKIARYDRLPHVIMEEGKTYSTDIKVFNVFRAKDYEICIHRLCHKDRVMVSHEKGHNIRSWRHKLDIEPALQGAVWNEVIEVDAGFLTPFVSQFAKFMYLKRHQRRGAVKANAELKFVGGPFTKDPVGS